METAKYLSRCEWSNQSVACPENGISLSNTKITAMILANVARLERGRGNKSGKNGATVKVKAHSITRKIRH